jgi:hypothetical protein
VSFDTDTLFDATAPDRLRIPVAGIYRDVRLQVGASTDTTLVTNSAGLPSLAVIWLAPAP